MEQEMLRERDSRTLALLGEEGLEKLRRSRVLVAGLGGVGGYAAEMLLRSGVGAMTLVDADSVTPSNINRQIIAMTSTVGKPKAILFSTRFHDIHPDADIDVRCMFLSADNVGDLLVEGYDFVVDAIDTVAPKTALLMECIAGKTRVISSMGAGGRIDPTKVGYYDLWETREDGLARAVRQSLKKRGVRCRIPVVASVEAPHRGALIDALSQNKLTSFGTLPTIPALFGIYLANYVIRKITGQ